MLLLAVVGTCAAFLAGAVQAYAAPTEDQVYYRHIYPHQNGSPMPDAVKRVDPTGVSNDMVAGPEPQGWVNRSGLSVSPDGQAVVFWGSHMFNGWLSSGIGTVSTSGDDSHVLIDNASQDASYRFPRFAADNTSIIVNRLDDITWEDDLYLIHRKMRTTSGSQSIAPLITWPGDQYDGVFSPNGNYLYFTSSHTPAGASHDRYRIYRTDSDGSNPVLIDSIQGLDDVWYLQISPSGSRLTFAGLNSSGSYDIYTVATDGTDLEQVTNTVEDEYSPSWSPSGSKIVFSRGEEVVIANPDGSNELELVGSQSAYPAFRQPSAIVDIEDVQAAKFRPHWQFDSGEHWRPLNVNLFMAERDPSAPTDAFHRICADVVGCDNSPLLAASDVEPWSDGWVDIGSIGGQSPDDFYSPRSGCTVNGLRDCDGADKSNPNFNSSAVYYNAVVSPGAYRYLDYWTFYRFNDMSVNEHEGDWEGITVVPSTSDPDTIDAVGMAQHSHVIWYLPGSLACDAGGSGSCEPGMRPWVYVASGGHSSYSSYCNNDLVAIPPQACFTPDNLPEGDHRGDASWGRNEDDPGSGALLELPPAGDGNWTDWVGRWGASCAPLYQCTFPSPRSPGQQGRFQCPWRGNEEELCPGDGQRIQSLDGASARDTSAQACGNWMAPDLVAVACSPSRLGAAVEQGALGTDGSLRIVRGRSGPASASARGIAQLPGDKLKVGESLWIRGHAAGDTQLVVTAQDGATVYQARFDRLPALGRKGLRIDVRRKAGDVVFATYSPGVASRSPIEVRTTDVGEKGIATEN